MPAARRTLPAILLAATAALTLAPQQAAAWGRDGHRAIGTVAERLLAPSVAAEVQALLKTEGIASLADIASWADEIRRERPDTGPYHYVNTPVDAVRYDHGRDCPTGACVGGGLDSFARILADRGRPAAERLEALKFVVHLAGDLHQPLHVGTRADRGGNAIRASFRDRADTNLHAVWDSGLVRAVWPEAAAENSVIADDLLASMDDRTRAIWYGGGAVRWTEESFHIAHTVIYPGVGGPGEKPAPFAIPDSYVEQVRPIVRERLGQAAVRLATVLTRALHEDGRGLDMVGG